MTKICPQSTCALLTDDDDDVHDENDAVVYSATAPDVSDSLSR